ncbi:hypothetical protein FGIG_01597, partial [Fasciola gigantica]
MYTVCEDPNWRLDHPYTTVSSDIKASHFYLEGPSKTRAHLNSHEYANIPLFESSRNAEDHCTSSCEDYQHGDDSDIDDTDAVAEAARFVKIWFQNRRYKVKRQAQDKSIEEATVFQHNLRCSSDSHQCVFAESRESDDSNSLFRSMKIDKHSTSWTQFLSSAYGRPCISRSEQPGVQSFSNWPERYTTSCPIPALLSEHLSFTGANGFPPWSSFTAPVGHVHDEETDSHPGRLSQPKSHLDLLPTSQHSSLDSSLCTRWESGFPLSRMVPVQNSPTANYPTTRYPSYSGWPSISQDSTAYNTEFATPNLMDYLTMAGWRGAPICSPTEKIEAHEPHTNEMPDMVSSSYKEVDIHSPFAESTHLIPYGNASGYENDSFSGNFSHELNITSGRELNQICTTWTPD